MESKLDSFKRCLTGAIVAMAKDEELEKFYKKLMKVEKNKKCFKLLIMQCVVKNLKCIVDELHEEKKWVILLMN